MKQDADWQVVSDSYDPLTLLKLIEKIILKQSDNQYKIGIIMEQLKLLLAYRQGESRLVKNHSSDRPQPKKEACRSNGGVRFRG
jgi:hypothetical protein